MEPNEKRAVWDLPTRLFHWLLVGLFGFLWWSGENHVMDWHMRAGIAVAGLIIFRVIWGFVGGSTARFAQFVKGPGKILAYLKSDGAPPLGHNPLGALSVIALLVLIAVQVGFGLFATGEEVWDSSGPLSFLVDFDTGQWAADQHHFIFNILLLFTLIHVAAILFYWVIKKRNLVKPMITGSEPTGEAGSRDALVRAPWPRLVVAIIIAATLAYYVANGLKF